MFIDELTIHLKAGHGGGGVVAWLHEKGKEFGGPAGGDGGAGGNIFARTVRDIGILSKYRYEKELRAESGESGKGKGMHGANGRDIEVSLPIGSVVLNRKTGAVLELLREGERVLLLRGGRGGFGNKHFKGSKNVYPTESTPGKLGEEAEFFIELRLVADAGLIGLPNAGKSSLLNELSNAGAKVGAYEFTTLEPNLGNFYGYIVADIPGLIQGASRGKGLGHKFLRHIRRTKILLHAISVEHADLPETLKTVRSELGAYDPALMEKPEVLVLTKTDLASPSELAKKKKALLKEGRTVLSVSVIDDDSLKAFRKNLLAVLEKFSK